MPDKMDITAAASTEEMQKVFLTKDVQETAHYYNKWSTTYDKTVQDDNYNGPKLLADLITRFVQPTEQILDVVGGTGLVVEQLQALTGRKWNSVDVLDGSKKMIEEAKAKKVYRNSYCEFIDPKGSQVPTGKYDAVVSCGGFSPGALDESHLPEMVRYVRKGGLLLIAGREAWLRENSGPPYNWNHHIVKGMEDMEKAGVWELVHKETAQDYCAGFSGLLFVYRKL